MKKSLTTLACATLLTLTANADMLKIEGGAGAWMQEPSGKISYTDEITHIRGTDKSTSKETTQGYAWINIKHFVPIIPNFRFEYANIESKGMATGSFEDFEIPIGQHSNTTLTMKQYDIIPYYNLLDNTFWITLDLGIDIKITDTSYEADAVDLKVGNVIIASTENYSESETVYLPLVYLRTRVEIPNTDIGIEADGKFISYSGNNIYDVRAKIDYTLDFVPVIKPAIEVGYRMQRFNYDDDGAVVDLEFSGMYVGMYLRY